MPMRVLFLAHHGLLDGSNRSLLSLLSGLQRFDIEPHVIVPHEGGLTKELRKNQIPAYVIPVAWWMSDKHLSTITKIQRFSEILRCTRMIRRLVKEIKIHIIYTNTNVTPEGAIISMIDHIPNIWHFRAFGDLDFSLEYIFPKHISTNLINRSKAIICHSKIVERHLFDSYPRPVHQIYNGSATIDQFDQRLKIREESTRNRIFCFSMVSSITPKKGQEVALRAMSELQKKGVQAKLLIVGSGRQDYLDHLLKLVRELKLDSQIIFSGFVEDPFQEYFHSDCVLICSEHEALSRVGLEAMSTALPLIGKNSGGNPEIIIHEETGFLYNTFDELVDYMEKLVGNPTLGHNMGIAGWTRAREIFNIEKYSSSVYQVFRSVLDEA